ncbi:MAG: YiiX/YebB-like N1pC/P60 family cysteine hydrolase [Candidatus Eremiobacteraeota bacterium]|nr:YiiX/YebB-like N1pC/P60 family cysteine hydrolase [Candidatus Eremiobacteraeota bacterium]
MKIQGEQTPPALPVTPPAKKEPEAGGSTLPVPADQYKGAVEEHHWVKDADLATYKKVYGAIGAATMAFASHFAMAGGFAAAGAAIGGIAGAVLGGPVGALVGKVAGGAVGAYAGAKIQGKTKIGRKAAGRIGGMIGNTMGLFAKALKIPLRSDHIKETKDYSYEKMKTHLDTTTYTSHPRINEKDADEFISKLKPGDVVLTNDEACTIFSLLIVAADGKADFNHALLYTGDGKTIEARTVTHGVAEGDLKDVLGHKHHAVAIRPHYEPEEKQASDVVQAGKDMIGIPYDYRFKMSNDAMYCSEVVYKAVKKGAPQINFKKRPLITREVVLPGDLLRTKQAEVIAEVGKDNTLFNSFLAKFI